MEEKIIYKQEKKEIETSVEKETQKLDNVVRGSQMILMRFSSIFPFDFFPTTVTIDRNKVSVNEQLFFWSRQMISLSIKDLMTVILESNLFFGSLQFVDKFYPQDTISINFLHKSEAIKARRLLEGLVVAHKENISLDELDERQLVDKLIEIGKSRTG